ncbi:MAG: winged helix-turn-helix transcriptional regulator [Proteobacteria bacterium]|nr:winged helix-turn-helix transcriptional regulator [Pseudomonadota bacterium]
MPKPSDLTLEVFSDKDTASDEFLRERFSTLDAVNLTAAELLTEAKKEGWDNRLRDLTVEEFSRIINLPEPEVIRPTVIKRPKQIEAPKVPAVHPSPTPEVPPDKPQDVDNFVQSILTFLRENPWCHVAAIVKNVDLAPEAINQRLEELKEIGWIKTVGQNANARYALT